MAVEHVWSYDRIATPGEAANRKCIFCGEVIGHESQPAHWQLKAVEDKQDADYIIEDGYAHHSCTQDYLAQQRRNRFTLPEVPDGPGGR